MAAYGLIFRWFRGLDMNILKINWCRATFLSVQFMLMSLASQCFPGLKKKGWWFSRDWISNFLCFIRCFEGYTVKKNIWWVCGSFFGVGGGGRGGTRDEDFCCNVMWSSHVVFIKQMFRHFNGIFAVVKGHVGWAPVCAWHNKQHDKLTTFSLISFIPE